MQSTTSSIYQRCRAENRWLLGVVVAIGCILRLYAINDCLWVDELHTAWTVADGWADVAPRAAHGNNGPLYFWLVRSVTSTFGLHEWSVRLPSVLAGIGLIAGTYVVARAWRCAVPASLATAALVAVDSNAIFFAGEGRSYALVQCFALIHLYLFHRILTNSQHRAEDDAGIGPEIDPGKSSRASPADSIESLPDRSRPYKVRLELVAWVVTGSLLHHLHVTASLLVVAEVVAYVLLRDRTRFATQKQLSPLYLLIALGVMFVSTLPTLELLMQVASRRQNWANFVRKQPLQSLLTIYPLSIYVAAPLACGLLVRIAERLMPVQFVKRLADAAEQEQSYSETGNTNEHSSKTYNSSADISNNPTWKTSLMLCAFVFVLPLALTWLSTQLDIARLFHRRYLMASSVSLGLIAALLLTRLPRGLMSWLAALVVVVAGVMTISPLRYTPTVWGQALAHNAGEDWRSVVFQINEADESMVVILYSALIESDHWYRSQDPVEMAYCELPLRGIYRIAERQQIISLPMTQRAEIPQALVDKLATTGAWLVVRGNLATAQRVRNEVLESLGKDSSAWTLDETIRFDRISLTKIKSVVPTANRD